MSTKSNLRTISQQELRTTISNKSTEKAEKDRLQEILKIGIKNMMMDQMKMMMMIIGVRLKINKKQKRESKRSCFMHFFLAIQGQMFSKRPRKARRRRSLHRKQNINNSFKSPVLIAQVLLYRNHSLQHQRQQINHQVSIKIAHFLCDFIQK